MILRLLRAAILPEHVPTVLRALRAEADRARSWPGMVGWTHGVRRDDGLVRGIAVSAWADLDALLGVARGQPDRDVSDVSDTGLLREVTTEHYELSEPTDPRTLHLDGEVLGVVWGRIRPNVEADVHEMVRQARPTVAAAGVRTLLVGRRIAEGRTEIAIVAIWRDRLSLHGFAHARTAGAIDRAFTAQLDRWRFETYDCLPAERTTTLPTGPAVLVLDEGRRCVDATPGVEAVLGFPGELLLRQPLDDALDGPSRVLLAAAFASDAPAPRPLTLRFVAPDRRTLLVVGTLGDPSPRDALRSLTLDRGSGIDAESQPVDIPA